VNIVIELVGGGKFDGEVRQVQVPAPEYYVPILRRALNMIEAQRAPLETGVEPYALVFRRRDSSLRQFGDAQHWLYDYAGTR